MLIPLNLFQSINAKCYQQPSNLLSSSYPVNKDGCGVYYSNKGGDCTTNDMFDLIYEPRRNIRNNNAITVTKNEIRTITIDPKPHDIKYSSVKYNSTNYRDNEENQDISKDVTVTRFIETTKTMEKPLTLFREMTTTVTIEKPIINYKVTTFTTTKTVTIKEGRSGDEEESTDSVIRSNTSRSSIRPNVTITVTPTNQSSMDRVEDGNTVTVTMGASTSSVVSNIVTVTVNAPVVNSASTVNSNSNSSNSNVNKTVTVTVQPSKTISESVTRPVAKGCEVSVDGERNKPRTICRFRSNTVLGKGMTGERKRRTVIRTVFKTAEAQC